MSFETITLIAPAFFPTKRHAPVEIGTLERTREHIENMSERIQKRIRNLGMPALDSIFQLFEGLKQPEVSGHKSSSNK